MAANFLSSLAQLQGLSAMIFSEIFLNLKMEVEIKIYSVYHVYIDTV